ncbi:MAG: transposase family protein [Actinomycetota bacterium]
MPPWPADIFWLSKVRRDGGCLNAPVASPTWPCHNEVRRSTGARRRYQRVPRAGRICGPRHDRGRRPDRRPHRAESRSGGLSEVRRCVDRVHDRTDVRIRDMAVHRKPTYMVWRKRRFRCEQSECERATFSEAHPETLRVPEPLVDFAVTSPTERSGPPCPTSPRKSMRPGGWCDDRSPKPSTSSQPMRRWSTGWGSTRPRSAGPSLPHGLGRP